MSSVPHPTRSGVSLLAGDHTAHAAHTDGDRLGRVVLFLTAPLLAFAYYTAVTVLKAVGRGHE